MCSADVGTPPDFPCPSRPELNYQRDLPLEILIYQILFIFEVFSKLIQHLAPLGLIRISHKNEMNADPFYQGLVFEQAAFELSDELIQLTVLPLGSKYQFHASIDQPIERLFKLAV